MLISFITSSNLDSVHCCKQRIPLTRKMNAAVYNNYFLCGFDDEFLRLTWKTIHMGETLTTLVIYDNIHYL